MGLVIDTRTETGTWYQFMPSASNAKRGASTPGTPGTPGTPKTPGGGVPQGSALRRHLSLRDAIAQSIGAIGPVGAIALVTPLIVGAGAAGKGAGNATPLAIIAAGVGIYAIAWIIGRFATRIHRAGSLYDYVTEAFGERIGFIVAWVYYFGLAVLAVSISLAVGAMTSELLGSLGIALSYWSLSIVFAALLFCLLFFDVRVSTTVQLGLSAISIIAVLVFSIYVIAMTPSLGTTPFHPSSAKAGFPGLFYGVLYGTLIFTGFETAANLAEETVNPQREIPRALVYSLGLVIAFYAIGAYAQSAGFGGNDTKWVESTVPLFALAGPEGYGSRWTLGFFQVLVTLDVMAAAIGCAVATTRGLFALARAGRLPSALSRVHSRQRTPIVAATVVALAAAAFALVVGLTKGLIHAPAELHLPEFFPVFAWTQGLGGFCLVLVYVSVCIAGCKRLWASESKAKVAIATFVGGSMGLGALWGAIYNVPPPQNLVPWVALGWVVLGTLMAFSRPAAAATPG